MITQASFIIRPKPELQAAAKGSDLEGTPFSTEAVLWICEIADRACWSRQDIEDGIKEAFLHHLRTEFLSVTEVSKLGLEGELTATVFDRYWVVESFFGADQQLEYVLMSMPKSIHIQNRFLRARHQAAMTKSPETPDSTSST